LLHLQDTGRKDEKARLFVLSGKLNAAALMIYRLANNIRFTFCNSPNQWMRFWQIAIISRSSFSLKRGLFLRNS